MNEKTKAREQLLGEINKLRERIVELEHSEVKYENIIELAPDTIVTLDLKGIVTSCNTVVSKITGYSREEIIGKHFSKLKYLRAKDILKYLKIFNSLLQGKIPKPLEVEYVHKSGALRRAEIHVALMKKNKRIIGIQVIGRDITERKHVEEALKNFSRRLLLVREEEKKRISENIHREVGHITGTLDLITDSVKKKITSGDLTAALESCRKFKPIFHDFISNLRTLIHVLRPPELDIIGLTGTLSHYFADIEKETGLKIIFQSTMNEKKIRGDTPIILFRVVQEAVNNILKHSEANRVRVGLKCARGMIILTIKDNGRGFVPLKDKKKGESGIGLRLIGEMVESMNGTFEIHSSPGKGTELFVSLPPAKLPNPKPPSRKRKG